MRWLYQHSLCCGTSDGLASDTHDWLRSCPGPCSPARPAAIENFDCKPAECVLDLTLRLQGGGVGRVELLEQAILQLCEAL